MNRRTEGQKDGGQKNGRTITEERKDGRIEGK